MNDFIQKIDSIGGIAYYVGGCVRDSIMNISPKDIDIVVCGITTSQFMDMFPYAKQTGKSFPVYRIHIDGNEIEVAFARKEKKVAVGHSGFDMDFSPTITIEEDLLRRDITINAIAQNIQTNEIIDPYNGISDIQNGIIRHTSFHFVEDSVRVLRVARFAARYGFTVSDNTISLMCSCKEELAKEPKERIVGEMKSALSTRKPSIFFDILKKCDCLFVTFPEIYALIGKTQPLQYHPEGDAYNHSMIVLDKVSDMTDDITIRFAALYHDIGKGLTPMEDLPKHYGHDFKGSKLIKNLPQQYDNRMKEIASFVAKNHMRIHTMKNATKIVWLLRDMKRKHITVDMVTPILIADHDNVPSWFNDTVVKYVFKKVKMTDDITNRGVEYIQQYVQNVYVQRYKEIMREV